jgi:hypothetical protein
MVKKLLARLFRWPGIVVAFRTDEYGRPYSDGTRELRISECPANDHQPMYWRSIGWRYADGVEVRWGVAPYAPNPAKGGRFEHLPHNK